MVVESHSLEQTRAFAAKLARRVTPGAVIALNGDLGCGKTEFVRGFVHALNPVAAVHSPTFTVVNAYQTPRFPVYQFDVYRLGDGAELIEIGFEEYVAASGVCLIEWAELFAEELPSEVTYHLCFTDCGPTLRRIELIEPQMPQP